MVEIKRALAPFRRRLRLESLSHAAAYGCAAGLGAVSVWLMLLHIEGQSPDVRLCAGIFAAAALLVGALLYVTVYRPTIRRTAARMDAVGLQERVRTMVALQGDDALLSRLQREDAQRVIAETDVRWLRLRWPVRGLIACLIAAVLTTGLAVLPFEHPVQSVAEAGETEEARLIRQMIDDLRARIEAADISEEERQRLLAELEAAEKALATGDADVEALAEMTRATGEIVEELNQMEMFQKWAYTLLQYEELAVLGQAILDKDVEGASMAVAAMRADIYASETSEIMLNKLTRLMLDIQQALETSPPDDSEAYLGYIFANFSDEIQSAAAFLYTNMDPVKYIEIAFYRFDSRLRMYLSGEEIIEMVEEDDKTDDTKYVAQSAQEAGEGDGASKGRTEGEDTSEGTEGETAELLYADVDEGRRGTGSGTRDEQYHAEAAVMYEPSRDISVDPDYVPGKANPDGTVQRKSAPYVQQSGMIPYTDVYGVYYAQLLEQLEKGEIPASLLEEVEAYFYSM